MIDDAHISRAVLPANEQTFYRIYRQFSLSLIRQIATARWVIKQICPGAKITTASKTAFRTTIWWFSSKRWRPVHKAWIPWGIPVPPGKSVCQPRALVNFSRGLLSPHLHRAYSLFRMISSVKISTNSWQAASAIFRQLLLSLLVPDYKPALSLSLSLMLLKLSPFILSPQNS